MRERPMGRCFELAVEHAAVETLAQRIQLHASINACEKVAHGLLL